MSAETSAGQVDKKVMVLLVEDSEDDAFFFHRILRISGEPCDYVHLENGRKAVEWLETMAKGKGPRQTPILMFLDLKMPVLNGFEVLAWIKTNRFPHSLVVVVLSGSDDPLDLSRALELGAVSYVVKPISLQRLGQEIRNVRARSEGSREPPQSI